MGKTFDIKCSECEGLGERCAGHPNDPDAGIFQCPACNGEGTITVTDWDMESLLAAGAAITYEEAVAALIEEGHYPEDADNLARHYGYTPV